MPRTMLRFFSALTVLLFTSVTAAVSAEDKAAVDVTQYLGTHWYGLYLQGSKAGFAAMWLKEGDFEGKPVYEVGMDMTMQLQQMGVKAKIVTVDNRYFDRKSGDLLGIESKTDSVGGSTVFSARVNEGKLQGNLTLGGQENAIVAEGPFENIHDALADIYNIKANPAEGQKFTTREFDTTLLKNIESETEFKGKKTISFDGVPTEVYHFYTKIPEVDVTADSYITEEGVLLQDSFGPFVMRLEEESLAKSGDFVNDVLIENSVVPDVKIANPAALESLTMDISGIPDQDLILDDARQHYVSRGPEVCRLETRVARADESVAVKLPIDPAGFREELAPTVYIQSDSPEIVSLAKEIVKEERNSLVAARNIKNWVFKNLKKDFTATFSNALDTLHSRKGDCTEHSVLFVALCRAAGIPAKEVAGLVYSRDDGAFFFHQWAEVYVGSWLSMDPTLNQDFADPTHIKLVQGGLSAQLKILKAMGKLKIAIVKQ